MGGEREPTATLGLIEVSSDFIVFMLFFLRTSSVGEALPLFQCLQVKLGVENPVSTEEHPDSREAGIQGCHRSGLLVRHAARNDNDNVLGVFAVDDRNLRVKRIFALLQFAFEKLIDDA